MSGMISAFALELVLERRLSRVPGSVTAIRADGPQPGAIQAPQSTIVNAARGIIPNCTKIISVALH
jgi:hypothetical protein